MSLPELTPSRPGPSRAVAVLALLAMFDSMFNYFWAGNGIHGTEGALLVVVTTVLLTAAALAILFRWITKAFAAVLEVLMFLDFLGSTVAAYFLEAWLLVALLALGFVAWIIHLMRPSRTGSVLP